MDMGCLHLLVVALFYYKHGAHLFEHLFFIFSGVDTIPRSGIKFLGHMIIPVCI